MQPQHWPWTAGAGPPAAAPPPAPAAHLASLPLQRVLPLAAGQPPHAQQLPGMPAAWAPSGSAAPAVGGPQTQQHAPPNQAGFAGGAGTGLSDAAPQGAFGAAAVYEDRVRAVRELPEVFQPAFSFRYFNIIQSECFDTVYGSDSAVVVAAPTGSGKTGVMELAMVRLWAQRLDAAGALVPPMGRCKAVYLAPIRALVQERHADWSARFGALGLSVVELSGDSGGEARELEGADLICTTPEKFDHVSRRAKEAGIAGFLGDISLVLVDEVHLLHEPGRGASLEAGVVCRLKLLAGLPEMAGAPVTRLRFVAVSATIPNIGDVAAWLGVPPDGVKVYGEELRPVKLTTTVKGYAPAKNDFLFERCLSKYVFGVITEHANGRPALVFCSSRNSTSETAQTIAREAQQRRGPGPGGPFVRSAAQLSRLQQAAAATKNKALQASLPLGIGFHNAAMEAEDRALVEALFRESLVMVLCTTSTLAMGVNLPAHLVVVKGTRRYVGTSEAAQGEGTGYAEYARHEVLQMVGRAGRPQFDTEGVAVIMTQRSTAARYAALSAGQEEVESCLLDSVAEHLNAEVVLGTVRDVSLAIAWLKTTFLYVRIRANPRHYKLVLPPGTPESEIDRVLRDELVMKNVATLVRHQLMATDDEGFELTATEGGRLMARHFVRLGTMVTVVTLPRPQASMEALIGVLARAEEFGAIMLRRTEKKLLNTINHRPYSEGGCRFPVIDAAPAPAAAGGGAGGAGGAAAPRRVKARIQTAAEKIQILINDALSDRQGQGPGEALDYALRQEQDQLLRVGQRLLRCMAQFYASQRRLAAAGNAALLGRALRQRLWEDSPQQVRQLPNVGRLTGQRLQAAGMGTLQALIGADPRRVELAAQRAYPFGATLQSEARGALPPAVRIEVRQSGPTASHAGAFVECEVTLTRSEAAAPASEGAAAAGGQGAAGVGGTADAPATLLVGCPGSDELLLHRTIRLGSFVSPLQIRVKAPVAPLSAQQQEQGGARPVLLAALLPEKVSGADVTAHAVLQRRGGGAFGNTEPSRAAEEGCAQEEGGQGAASQQQQPVASAKAGARGKRPQGQAEGAPADGSPATKRLRLPPAAPGTAGARPSSGGSKQAGNAWPQPRQPATQPAARAASAVVAPLASVAAATAAAEAASKLAGRAAAGYGRYLRQLGLGDGAAQLPPLLLADAAPADEMAPQSEAAAAGAAAALEVTPLAGERPPAQTASPKQAAPAAAIAGAGLSMSIEAEAARGKGVAAVSTGRTARPAGWGGSLFEQLCGIAEDDACSGAGGEDASDGPTTELAAGPAPESEAASRLRETRAPAPPAILLRLLRGGVPLAQGPGTQHGQDLLPTAALAARPAAAGWGQQRRVLEEAAWREGHQQQEERGGEAQRASPAYLRALLHPQPQDSGAAAGRAAAIAPAHSNGGGGGGGSRRGALDIFSAAMGTGTLGEGIPNQALAAPQPRAAAPQRAAPPRRPPSVLSLPQPAAGPRAGGGAPRRAGPLSAALSGLPPWAGEGGGSGDQPAAGAPAPPLGAFEKFAFTTTGAGRALSSGVGPSVRSAPIGENGGPRRLPDAAGGFRGSVARPSAASAPFGKAAASARQLPVAGEDVAASAAEAAARPAPDWDGFCSTEGEALAAAARGGKEGAAAWDGGAWQRERPAAAGGKAGTSVMGVAFSGGRAPLQPLFSSAQFRAPHAAFGRAAYGADATAWPWKAPSREQLQEAEAATPPGPAAPAEAAADAWGADDGGGVFSFLL
ncbi:ATP-dependent DNA helicase-like protein [Raphidocelis subcapitata]|uniref:DNA 3'-5' helicase n=1 Tax=Raphidocelis subcapitata TaxID=307507 RepID=A0A2V0NWV3_9CHLO|nr:ATP-dependent DNA helicase-like protein [Raphidocelis subcapitata]|eukprot:GBF89417.1 ATP-dependent DNA helicase-like protein [Raphidocelis subcapitata]